MCANHDALMLDWNEFSFMAYLAHICLCNVVLHINECLINIGQILLYSVPFVCFRRFALSLHIKERIQGGRPVFAGSDLLFGFEVFEHIAGIG